MAEFRCVAIETATNVCSIAACNGESSELLFMDDARSSSRQLYSRLAELMEVVELLPSDLNCIAFGCGPGGFTGVRVAAAAAQALAFSQSIPVCKVSSLAALAGVAIRRGYAGTLAVCTDARMDEVYYGVYSAGEEGGITQLVADQLVQPANLILPTEHGMYSAVGNGWGAWPLMLENNSSLVDSTAVDCFPDALAVLEIARSDFAAGHTVLPAEALPNYVRNNVTHR